ncbi:MarR family transcriptional regulator [Ruegeria sp.]|uniref:MarR family winged helix-turn-helix transcriptional regulator n=1 Tax=Ruegeria sp. TaxID=1879320 RepID=UPI00231FCA92|nr:MarR family transcriptional regulator [Ruegeria sp.]MDA7965435.1 MarR family transcriptional regulator [Ruegeria sp.]
MQIRQNWPEAETPETTAMLGIIRLRDIVMDATRQLAADFGLTQAGFEVLTTLRAQPEPRRLTPTELYRAVLITSGGMTKVLKQLESEGLITREDDPNDLRSRAVVLTEAGARQAEAAMAAVNEQDKRLLGGALSDDQINRLVTVLLQTARRVEGAGIT